jgi:hypothetical protein
MVEYSNLKRGIIMLGRIGVAELILFIIFIIVIFALFSIKKRK